uniref:Uncharacterized protein n=1 Tax=Candidatus Kentrum sp. MB TaxID=2138164 RepID=A0A451B899_9GAMM|nr:MAG: hypothetical protein BECKMB1821H_GA0114242_100560 [Candidatus Kentron sp. MB]
MPRHFFMQREAGFPEIKVLEKASRRRFTVEYKRRILAEGAGWFCYAIHLL